MPCGLWEGDLGGINGHLTFPWFLDAAEHHGAMGTRQNDARALPSRRVGFTDPGLAPGSVVMVVFQGHRDSSDPGYQGALPWLLLLHVCLGPGWPESATVEGQGDSETHSSIETSS